LTPHIAALTGYQSNPSTENSQFAHLVEITR